MKILFKNAQLISMVDGDCFSKSNVLVDQNRIVYIGQEEPSADKVIDCENKILMPGLKNAHAHSAMIKFRGIGEGLPLDQWLQEIFKAEEELTPQIVYDFTSICIDEYLQGGTTGYFDMYFFPWENARAAKDKGIRCSNLIMIESHPERFPKAKEMISEWSNSSLLRGISGFHAEYTIGEDIKYTKELSEFFRSPVWTHNSETLSEVTGSKERRNGLTPTEWMDQQGLFAYGGGGYHCVWLSDNDRRIFKEHNLIAVICIGSNIQLNDGIPPVDTYLNDGIRMAIGTDGPASNASVSLWREMRLIKQHFPSVPSFEILKMATTNSAIAMGFNDATSIEVGSLADLILVNQNPSIDDLVLKTNDNDVKLVCIDGKIVFKRE